jgi:stearoyl-CoA desaturase (delta-9 desaturase)
VALVTFGEGWHNNHHAHPVSARHGLAWYEFDLSFLQIKLLEKLGIATAVKVARVDEALAE